MLSTGMAAGGLLLVAAVASMAASAGRVSGFSGAGGFQRVFALERTYRVGERVELEEMKARDRARHARILQGFSRRIVDFPVGGSADPYSVGLYYTKVRLGSPPQEFSVQIDTGSDFLWVKCNSCSNCPRNSGLGIPVSFYDAGASSTASPISCYDSICNSIIQRSSAECTAENNQCSFSFQYGDGSGASGSYVSDVFHFDTLLGSSLVANSSASVLFGCGTSVFGDLTESIRAVDGIFGFGQHSLSVISQLSSRGLTARVFSHCLNGEGNGGGMLIIGEISDPSIIYTPLVTSRSHYNLNLQSIAVNGQSLPIDEAVFSTSGSQGTIVDSGTTLALLVEAAYDPLVAAITAAVAQSVKSVTYKGNQCYMLSTGISEVFPAVTLNFAEGASLLLRPKDYLLPSDPIDGTPVWCVGFVKVPNQDTTILGDLVLKDKIIVYDLARQRIGWADFDCSSVNVSITYGRDEFVNTGQLSVSQSSSTLLPFKACAYYCSLLLLHLLALSVHT